MLSSTIKRSLHFFVFIVTRYLQICKQNVKTDVTWVKESNFASIILHKTDFVIFEDFKGLVFENVKETKCA